VVRVGAEVSDAVHNETTKKRRRRTWEAAFLASLALTGNVTESAKAAHITRPKVYEFRTAHPDFAAEWEAALDQAADVLETEARRRAVDGVTETVYQGGKAVGTVQRYSDTLLIFLLNGMRPEKYKQVVNNQITGKGGKALDVVMRWNDGTDDGE